MAVTKDVYSNVPMVPAATVEPEAGSLIVPELVKVVPTVRTLLLASIVPLELVRIPVI